ncbi:GNAT family N-acetyltransferase [Aliiglaciecola sp.]|nr:GNAT family N-acetyltransferase [Aliiglaciecola sp.]
MQIREANQADFEGIWPIFQSIVEEGDTYAYDKDSTRDDGFKVWMTYPRKTFVVEENNQILGTYYIVSNHAGPGAHVCNCGYMVSSAARGRGLATSMCEHSQQVARELGYKAMQFNFVASSNLGAIRLWEKLGFNKVGTLPGAFAHPSQGFIDAFVMYKWLD